MYALKGYTVHCGRTLATTTLLLALLLLGELLLVELEFLALQNVAAQTGKAHVRPYSHNHSSSIVIF